MWLSLRRSVSALQTDFGSCDGCCRCRAQTTPKRLLSLGRSNCRAKPLTQLESAPLPSLNRERKRFRQFAFVPYTCPFERFERAGLVDVNECVKLLRDVGLKIMAQPFRFR